MQIKEKDLENLKIEVDNKVAKKLEDYDLPNYFKKVRNMFESPSYKKMIQQFNRQNEIYSNAMRSMIQSPTFEILKSQVQAMQFTIPNYMMDSMALQLSQISNISSFWQANYDRILGPTRQIAEAMKNLSQINLSRIHSIINSINFNNIFESYNYVFEDVDFNNIEINNNGSIQYDDEVISIDENSDGLLQRLNYIEKNITKIDKKLSEKDKKLIIIFKWIIGTIIGAIISIGLQECYDNIKIKYKESKAQSTIGQTQQEFFAENYMLVCANELNVRETPSSNSNLIGKLYNYQCVKILEKVPYWSKVEYTNKNKSISIIGWVFNGI